MAFFESNAATACARAFAAKNGLCVCIPVVDLHCVVSASRCHNIFTAWAQVYGRDSTLCKLTSTSDRECNAKRPCVRFKPALLSAQECLVDSAAAGVQL